MSVAIFILTGFFVLMASGVFLFHPKLQRVYRVIHLFDEDKIARNFRSMYLIFNAKEIAASDRPFHFPPGKAIILPDAFSFEGITYKTSELP